MINKDQEVLMDKICRSCMTENADMRNIFESKELIQGQSLQLSEVLMSCASVQVSLGDGLPFLLCALCNEKLNSAFLFKQQCEKSDTTLRELKAKMTPYDIKQEAVEIQTDVDVDVYDNDNSYESSSEEEDQKRKTLFTCTYCQKVLRTKRGLKIHQRRHTGEKLRSCHLCQAQFTRTNHLVRHMQTHKDGGKHVCVECGLSFAKKFCLLKHEKVHTLSGNVKVQVADVKVEKNSDSNDLPDAQVCKEEEAEYECKFCKKVLTTSVGLRIHMRRHTGDNLATCHFCEKTFTKTSHLKRHMQTHGVTDLEQSAEADRNDRGKKVMECEFCDRKFKYKKSFSHHMQTEHGMSDDSDVPLSNYVAVTHDEPQTEAEEQQPTETPHLPKPPTENDKEPDSDTEVPEDVSLATAKANRNKIHICHVCECSFQRANHLTRHMTLHRAVLIYKCDKCEKAFAAVEFLEKHVKEDHIEKPYVCNVCNKAFSRGEHLIRHLKMHDGLQGEGTESLKCSICDRSFVRSDHLARHIKIHLQQDKRHVCGECGKAFNRLDNLKTHQRIHTGLKDNTRLHLCIYCGKEFNNSSNMIVHMRRHTGERPYKCNECGKGFPRSHDLKCHERTHSGEKPYLCTLCGKSFNKSNKLLRHTRVHTGERPYVCNLCGRAFTQSNDLALHMRRHTGSRPYACGMCPARFIQSGQLKAHRRQTGHWTDHPPELKGGHRVEPVTPITNPPPIKFKIHGKQKKLDEESSRPRILNQTVGIMGNINVQPEQVQPFVLGDGKLLEFHDVVGFASVGSQTGQTVEGEKDGVRKGVSTTFQCKGEVFSTSSGETTTTFTQSDSFGYQNFG